MASAGEERATEGDGVQAAELVDSRYGDRGQADLRCVDGATVVAAVTASAASDAASEASLAAFLRQRMGAAAPEAAPPAVWGAAGGGGDAAGGGRGTAVVWVGVGAARGEAARAEELRDRVVGAVRPAGGDAPQPARVVVVVDGCHRAHDAAIEALRAMLPCQWSLFALAERKSGLRRRIGRRMTAGAVDLAAISSTTVSGALECAMTAEQREVAHRRHVRHMVSAIERAARREDDACGVVGAPAAAAARGGDTDEDGDDDAALPPPLSRLDRAVSVAMGNIPSAAALAAVLSDDEEDEDPLSAPGAPSLTILHFNDVYNVRSTRTREPVGGADRFQTVLRSFAHTEPLVLFSGDCFSPSTDSTVTKGAHMVPVLNAFGISCAMVGNHDLDFGVDTLATLSGSTNFPWLMSNVVDRRTGRPLGEAAVTRTLVSRGVRVGVMGLAEKEWIDTLSCVGPDDVDYEDFVVCGRRLAGELRAAGADLVIALTHMREPNDVLLSREVPGIDLVLGGHDHFYSVTGNVIKSGCDFRDLSFVQVWVGDEAAAGANVPDAGGLTRGPRCAFTVDHVEVTAGVPRDEAMSGLVAGLLADVDKAMDERAGTVGVELDATFESVRTRESNVGNLIADVARRAYSTDVAFMVGGTIRSNDRYGPGDLTTRDIIQIFPFDDPTVVLRLTGAQLLAAAENGVSSVPKQDGRFPQVSGMRIVYDPDRPPGSRVDAIEVGGEPLEPERTYTVATRGYLSHGKDGFTMFKDAEVVLDEENGHVLAQLLRSFFWRVDVVNKLRRAKWREDVVSARMQGFALGDMGASIASASGPGAGPEQIVIAPAVEGRILTVAQRDAQPHRPSLSRLPTEVADFRDMTARPDLLRRPSGKM